MTSFATPNRPNPADYLIFIRQQGITPAALPDDSMWIGITYTVAIDTVNLALAQLCRSPIYTLAVYNLGVDRLINFANDQPNFGFFSGLRAKLKLTSFAPGVITSSSDQGTSESFQVVESLKNLTIGQLQNLKTDWGRNYLGFASAYGPTLWGLT